jgi:SAM-dependent methyltransferase
MVQVSSDSDHEPPVPEIPRCWSLEPRVVGNGQDGGGGWELYWEGLSDRQQRFRAQANEYVRNLGSVLPLESLARVLDFGCGFGFVAALLAPRVGEVFLWDASANMRGRARVNVATCQNIRFLDLSDPKAVPRDLHFNLIVVNSVVQYMTLDEFSAWLVQWRGMLAPGGRIVVSDLIPPGSPAILDIVDLLRFCRRHGFLARAIWQAFGQLVRHWRMKRARPLCRIGREELSRLAEAAGLAVSYLPNNLTHLTRRTTTVFTDTDHD